jgi:ftsK/spoIIIE family protein
MDFSMNKSQTQATSATSADVAEFGKNKFELEQFLLRNLNNALNINDESSYLNSFDIKVASNDSGVFYVPNLPVSYSLSKKLYFDIFAIFAGILYPYKTLLPQNNAYFVPYDTRNPNMARAFFFPWLDGVPTRLKISNLQTFIKEKVSEKHVPIMSNNVSIDMTKVVHVAISGSSGQGKTHFVQYLIYCLKSITNQIICIDPKLSDIYLLAKELNLEVFSPTKGSNLNSFIS